MSEPSSNPCQLPGLLTLAEHSDCCCDTCRDTVEAIELLSNPQQLPAPRDAEITRLRAALRNIQIEAERPQGNWAHMKRVIALQCGATLAAKEQP